MVEKRGITVAKRTAKAEIVEALEPVKSEAELVVEEVARTVLGFRDKAREFVRVAENMEQQARAAVADAERLKEHPPTTMEEDTAVQEQCKRSSAGKKATEEHWNVWCQPISRFHRFMTGGRAVTVDLWSKANAIQNDAHNRYVEQERRRVAQEQERVRREAEAQAAAVRAAELAQMELEAAEAEANSPALSERERTFADLALATRDSVGAARRAGYKDPSGAATRLLASPKVVAYMKGRQEAEALRRQAEAVRALPLEVVETARVEPQITRGAGVRGDRTTVSAEITDPVAFVRAVMGGAYGIPSDTLVPDQTVLNGYARSLGKLIERWPGIRLKTSTKVV